MAKGTISIGDNCVVQSSPPSLLALDAQEVSSKQRLIKVSSTTTLLPGESLLVPAPPDLPADSFIYVEPNLNQTQPFFTSDIVKLENGNFTVSNKLEDPVTVRKIARLSVYIQRVRQQ